MNEKNSLNSKIEQLKTENEDLDQLVTSLTTQLKDDSKEKLSNEQISVKSIELEQALKEIKKIKLENETLNFKIESYENKSSILEKEIDNYQNQNLSSEKRYKEDLFNYKNKFENTQNELQTVLNENATLKFEAEKQKQIIKSLDSDKTSDQVLIDQIDSIQNKYIEKEVKHINLIFLEKTN